MEQPSKKIIAERNIWAQLSYRQQNEQVQWRRNKVQEIRSKEYSQREISQKLLLVLATVKRLSYLGNQAKPNIRKYIDEGRYITRKVLRSRKENLWGYRLLPYWRSAALADNFGLQ